MAWIVTEGNEYADVHSNSGEFTYGGNDSLCGGIPENTCDPYTNYTVKADLEESRNFDSFISDCGKISKTITAKSCNQDMLVMWFNQGDNQEYPHVLDDNSIFDIKNVDDCEHIIISEHNIRVGNQEFEDSSYTDSGYPCISTDPCGSSSECKYVSGATYQGHKIKYHTINDTVPANFYVNHDELVELYFPHMYRSTDEGMNTRIIGDRAFFGCQRLSAITFSQVEEIKSEAFANCYDLKKIDWGHVDCCTSNLRKIGTSGFTNCSGMTELCLDKLDKIETIGAYGFYGCKNVTSFSLPTASTYTAVTEHCFEGLWTCPSFTIPTNIKRIESCAFGTWVGDIDIASITIPSSVTYIGSSAFSHVNVVYNLKWTESELNSVNIQTDAFSYNGAGLAPYKIMCPNGTLQAYKNYFNSRGMTAYAEAVVEEYLS